MADHRQTFDGVSYRGSSPLAFTEMMIVYGYTVACCLCIKVKDSDSGSDVSAPCDYQKHSEAKRRARSRARMTPLASRTATKDLKTVSKRLRMVGHHRTRNTNDLHQSPDLRDIKMNELRQLV
ncbi:hypothetical protein Tco_0523796, partial [Tanacetum coccineum]